MLWLSFPLSDFTLLLFYLVRLRVLFVDFDLWVCYVVTFAACVRWN